MSEAKRGIEVITSAYCKFEPALEGLLAPHLLEQVGTPG